MVTDESYDKPETWNKRRIYVRCTSRMIENIKQKAREDEKRVYKIWQDKASQINSKQKERIAELEKLLSMLKTNLNTINYQAIGNELTDKHLEILINLENVIEEALKKNKQKQASVVHKSQSDLSKVSKG